MCDTVNSVVLETLASRLRSAGKYVAQALTINAEHTTILTHQHTLDYQKDFFQLFTLL